MTSGRVLFYVQHLLGIGHLARTSRIADALVAQGFAVTVVTGGMPVPAFPGPGVDVVALPPMRSRDAEFSALVGADGEPIGPEYQQHRKNLLLACLESERPDTLVVEAYPFGRRQMRFELLPLLDKARAMRPRPLIVSSIRDILQVNRKPGRAEETAALVERYFDLVMIHGDPEFVKIDQSFPLTQRIKDKIAYTGLVAAPPPPPAAENFDVVVSCGGGAAAGELLDATIAAAGRLKLGRWCVVTGPNLAAAVQPLLPDGVELFTFREDFPALLRSARLSVSQAGYNTVCDILSAKCRSVLVPFEGNGETEQMMRAQALEALGLAEVVREAELSADRLTAAINAALASPQPRHNLDLNGAGTTAKLLRHRFDSIPEAG